MSQELKDKKIDSLSLPVSLPRMKTIAYYIRFKCRKKDRWLVGFDRYPRFSTAAKEAKAALDTGAIQAQVMKHTTTIQIVRR